jgi:hypothetical protein
MHIQVFNTEIPIFCPHGTSVYYMGSQNKQRLFLHTLWTDWFSIIETEYVAALCRSEYLNILYFNHDLSRVKAGLYHAEGQSCKFGVVTRRQAVRPKNCDSIPGRGRRIFCSPSTRGGVCDTPNLMFNRYHR